jgi:hypothetical protein
MLPFQGGHSAALFFDPFPNHPFQHIRHPCARHPVAAHCNNGELWQTEDCLFSGFHLWPKNGDFAEGR